MPFKKGDNNINREGRPKGTSYAIKLREQITEYCEANLLYFLEEMKSMKAGHAKSQAFLALLNFALPKLTESNSYIDIDKLSNQELDSLLERHLNTNENE
ncbi:MAG: hypothetical protein IPM51_16230 [Sphingobacteriaceae bacterium]|nr:hypothetical protein [Sphingobacteriaceae bacterium]